MDTFDFQRATDLDEARAAVASADAGKFLAGGQSLIPLIKLGMASPDRLVCVKGLDELRGIHRDGADVVIGAAMTHAEVAESDVVRDAIPGLADLVARIGDPQVRNRGTLGGSIAHADPAADYPAALLALGATVITDRREIGADDFFQGMFQTPLEPDELIRAVRFPIPDRAAYAKFPNPASKYAIAGVMVAQVNGTVRVAVTGAGPGVFRVSRMEEALSSSFDAGSLDGVEVDAGTLTSDLDASAEYRAHLVSVMARRAVEACA
ncbi:MAG: xanthine dehydrogenase family protein subunit M [Gemmatimonadetes bacterium]|nr:xanthine dehydrogenase family protein subunit M [Gemmatimonadota bacterium]